MAWLLGELHRGLIASPPGEVAGSKKAGGTASDGVGSKKGSGGATAAASSSIISKTFGGMVELTTMTKGNRKSAADLDNDMAVDESLLPMSGE